MWIPAPLYERAPKYWLFLGLLLMVTSTYLAFEMDRAFYFVGSIAGMASCVWSAMTAWKRSLYSEESDQDVTESAENA